MKWNKYTLHNVYFRNSFLEPQKDAAKTHDHSSEYSAKSGYKPNIKYKFLIIFWYISYTLKTKYRDLEKKSSIMAIESF
jgi:hypothetical protein